MRVELSVNQVQGKNEGVFFLDFDEADLSGNPGTQTSVSNGGFTLRAEIPKNPREVLLAIVSPAWLEIFATFQPNTPRAVEPEAAPLKKTDKATDIQGSTCKVRMYWNGSRGVVAGSFTCPIIPAPPSGLRVEAAT